MGLKKARREQTISTLLFLGAVLASYLLMSELTQDTRDKFIAAVPVIAIITSVLLPFTLMKETRVDEEERKVQDRATSLQIVKDGVSVYAGIVDSSIDQFGKTGAIPIKVYRPYRPYLSVIERNPENFQMHHLATISACESVISEKIGILSAASKGPLGGNRRNVQQVMLDLSDSLQDYLRRLSLDAEESQAEIDNVVDQIRAE